MLLYAVENSDAKTQRRVEIQLSRSCKLSRKKKDSNLGMSVSTIHCTSKSTLKMNNLPTRYKLKAPRKDQSPKTSLTKASNILIVSESLGLFSLRFLYNLMNNHLFLYYPFINCESFSYKFLCWPYTAKSERCSHYHHTEKERCRPSQHSALDCWPLKCSNS